MSSVDNSPLVSTTWLAAHLGNPGVRIIDVRWQSRYENGRGISFDDHDGYRAGHIPGAVFAGMIAELSDPEHPVPDMLAPPERFAAAMSRLGVDRDTLVVAYDNMGFPLGSARLWWALNYYGHNKVRVLDGGTLAMGERGADPDYRSAACSGHDLCGVAYSWLARDKAGCLRCARRARHDTRRLSHPRAIPRPPATVTCGGNAPVTFRAPSTFPILPMLIRRWRKRPRLSVHVFWRSDAISRSPRRRDS